MVLLKAELSTGDPRGWIPLCVLDDEFVVQVRNMSLRSK